jgi:hypothetical protein
MKCVHHHYRPHSTGARETTSISEDERGFIGIFYVHFEKVSTLHECFFFWNIVSQLYRTVCITVYNYKSSYLPDKNTDSGIIIIIIIIIRLDDKNSDTGGKNKSFHGWHPMKLANMKSTKLCQTHS